MPSEVDGGARANHTEPEPQIDDHTEPEPEVDEEACQECGVLYEDDDRQDAWIGCDNETCGRWFHYWCAGFKRKPTSRKKFICSYCE